MTTYGRFLEVPEVARMKSLLLWFVIYVYVRPGVVAEIELYPDVTSDDYPLDELSVILRAQEERQMALQQRQRQMAVKEEKFGAEEMATAAAAASAAASARAAGEGRTRAQRLPPFERPFSFELPSSSGRGQPVAQQRMSDALVPDSLAGFQPGSGVAQEPAFSYREPAGQAADGEAAPFAVSPKDPRFYEDAPSQMAELAGGDVYRSRDYGFRGGGEEGAGAGDVEAPADNNMWAERSGDLVQQHAPPAAAAAVPLAHVPQSSARQPGQTQRGGAKADGSSGSSGAKKTGMEPMAAAAGDSVGLGQPPPSGAAIPSQAMDREPPPGGAGPPAAASAGAMPPAALPDVGSVGGESSASDVAARAKAGADAAAHAYQTAHGNKGLAENEDDEEEAVMSTGIQSDFMSGQIKQKHMAVDNSDVYFIAIVAGCCAAAAVGIIGVGISWYRRKRRDIRDQEGGGAPWGHQAPSNLVHYQLGANSFKPVPISHMRSTSSGDLSYEDLRRSTIAICGLQKNAKAAADVEYPAYGVTGPKQDISPTSGDRRLAQSAQMYHYQHQKQQIIAMERPPHVAPVASHRGFSEQMFQEYGRLDEPDSSDRLDQTGDIPWEVLPGARPGMEERGSASEEEPTSGDRKKHANSKRSSIIEGSRTPKSTSLDRKSSLAKSPTGTPTRSSVAIATQKLDSVRGPGQMRRVIKGMNYVPKPRSASLPKEMERLSRTYSVPRNLARASEVKDIDSLSPEQQSKRKSIEIQRVIRKSIPIATQRLENSTRRAVEYLEERHKTLASAESKVRRPQPPEPSKPAERVTRRRRPPSPTHKQPNKK